MQTFLGLDLAWHDSGKTSALAVLRGDTERVELDQVESLAGDDEILDRIAESASLNTVLAIDAPLVINNSGGQRPCETEIGRRFSHADASAHTSNLSRFPNARGVRLAEQLVVRGWRHDVNPATDHQRFGRWLFEVYPHPAHVVLFDLPRIIKYKKGRMDSRREGLDNLRRAIVSHLGAGMPALIRNPTLQTLVEQDLSALRGPTLKEYEDRLDAVLCAFIAAHYWAWGRERNEMFGTMSFGYIVTPSRTVRGLRWTYERPARHMVPIVEQP